MTSNGPVSDDDPTLLGPIVILDDDDVLEEEIQRELPKHIHLADLKIKAECSQDDNESVSNLASEQGTSNKDATSVECSFDEEDNEPLSKRLCGKSNKKKQFKRILMADSDTSLMADYSFSANLNVSGSSSTTREWDNFCWHCHEKSYQKVRCSSCSNSFHANCVPVGRNIVNWRCLECVPDTKFNKRILLEPKLSQYIKIIIERSFENCYRNFKDFRMPNAAYIDPQELFNPLTLDDIQAKAKRDEYENIKAFFLDIRTMRHNYEIQHKNNIGPDNTKTFRDSARYYVEDCEDEVQALTLCPECYASNDDALSVCSKPHPLVWVQYGVYPYWPAKVKAKIKGKNPLEVFFFQDHQTGLVNYNQCYLYSKENPNEAISDSNTEFYEAIKEAQQYIENVEAKFGPFNFSPPKIVPTRAIMEKHLDDMIPGYRDVKYRFRHVGSTENKVDIVEPVKHTEDCNVEENAPTEDGLQDETDRIRIRFSQTFITKMNALSKYVPLLKQQTVLQKDEIDRLREENKRLKEEQQEKFQNDEIVRLREEVNRLKEELKSQRKSGEISIKTEHEETQ